MPDLDKINNPRANTFLAFLFFLILIGVAGYFVYNNPDFQRTHRRDIMKANTKLREYTKTAKEFISASQKEFADLKKSHKLPFMSGPQDKSPTFNELIYDPEVLRQEIPADMVRHQPDEITVCSFDANFLLNNSLSQAEVRHLANILRFCDLSSIAGLNNKIFITEVAGLLKTLRYNAVYAFSPAVGTKHKTFYAYLFRNDRITSLKAPRLISGTKDFPVAPYEGRFKARNFAFTLLTFQTPASGSFLPSIVPLENIYETVKAEDPDMPSVMIFGGFTFQSTGLSWDNSAFLPTVAELQKGPDGPDRSRGDLLGNFWFRKKDLVEFNGNSGVINIKEELFPSSPRSAVVANKPIWAQFKLMPDDN